MYEKILGMCMCGVLWDCCEQARNQSLFTLAYNLFTTTYSSHISFVKYSIMYWEESLHETN